MAIVRTKIICTIGPQSSNKATLCRLHSAGMNVARINMSHATHKNAKEIINIIKSQNLIDVRTPTEFNAGSVPSAINIPLNEVVNRLDELKELQPILVFCAAGIRSQKAIDFLIANGVNQVENGGGWLEVNARFNNL